MDQNLVPHLAAIAIIDRLEIVDVDDRNCETIREGLI